MHVLQEMEQRVRDAKAILQLEKAKETSDCQIREQGIINSKTRKRLVYFTSRRWKLPV